MGHGDVELAAAQQLEGRLGLELVNLHRDPRMARAEPPERARQEPPRGALEDAEAEPAPFRAARRREVGVRVLQKVAQRSPPRDEALPGVGEANGARRPFQQLRPALPLERGDLLRDGGRGQRQRAGGAGQRSVAADGVEDQQPARIDER